MNCTCRAVLQQCTSAKLKVQFQTDDQPENIVQINRGVVIFICFLRGASIDIIPKLAKSVLEVKLSATEEGKRCSILQLPGDVLIVPQATLGGKMKGKAIQYHNNIDKKEGQTLYEEFINEIKKQFEENKTKTTGAETSIIENGTYGNLQVLSMETNGPYTHIIDL